MKWRNGRVAGSRFQPSCMGAGDVVSLELDRGCDGSVLKIRVDGRPEKEMRGLPSGGVLHPFVVVMNDEQSYTLLSSDIDTEAPTGTSYAQNLLNESSICTVEHVHDIDEKSTSERTIGDGHNHSCTRTVLVKIVFNEYCSLLILSYSLRSFSHSLFLSLSSAYPSPSLTFCSQSNQVCE